MAEGRQQSGSQILSGPAASLWWAWQRFLRRFLESWITEEVLVPSVVPRALMDDSGYAANFPHQLTGVPPNDVLLPAACLAVYPTLSRAALPASVMVTARCCRNEDGHWEAPYRLRTFTMMELVMVGALDYVTTRRQDVARSAAEALTRLGLAGTLVPSTDSFFLPESSGSRMIQKLKELKHEYIENLSRMPLFSVNNHEGYFAGRFGLDDGDVESSCIAFGIERLTAAGLRRFGPHEEAWPAELRGL